MSTWTPVARPSAPEHAGGDRRGRGVWEARPCHVPPPGSLPPTATGAQSYGPVPGPAPGLLAKPAPSGAARPLGARAAAARSLRGSTPGDQEVTVCCQLGAIASVGPAQGIGGRALRPRTVGSAARPSDRVASGSEHPCPGRLRPGLLRGLGGRAQGRGGLCRRRRAAGSKGWVACSCATLPEMRGHHGAARPLPA